MRNVTRSLPGSEDILVGQNRHRVSETIKRCRWVIDSIVKSNTAQAESVRHGFRYSILKLDSLDSMFVNVYEQEKANFSFKCKFFYNRAVETKDTSVLREFVEDCDYYQVDKEWCNRARMVLSPHEQPILKYAVAGVSQAIVDTLKMEYDQAIISGNIELLEQYIKKYSARRFRRKNTRIDSAKIVLNSLKMELAEAVSFDKDHPLFANADMAEMELKVKGLQGSDDEGFRNAFEKAKGSLRSVSGIRFPASVVIDYSSRPPILFLNAYVSCKKDVERKTTDNGVAYTMESVPELMNFLNRIKLTVVEDLNKEGPGKQKEARELRQVAYVVRLMKNNEEYITLYGKENVKAGQGSGAFSFYNFFDLTVKDKKDTRLNNKASHIIEVQSSDDSDMLRRELVNRFFDK